MILKDGVNLEWVKNSTYPEKNLIWYATCTASTTDIHIIYLAPAPQKQ